MTGTAESDRPAPAPDESRRLPRPAHGFATEWCIDEDVPVTSEPAAGAPASGP